jgi:hypothetical protein
MSMVEFTRIVPYKWNSCSVSINYQALHAQTCLLVTKAARSELAFVCRAIPLPTLPVMG